jgi:hypothetical protein
MTIGSARPMEDAARINFPGFLTRSRYELDTYRREFER